MTLPLALSSGQLIISASSTTVQSFGTTTVPQVAQSFNGVDSVQAVYLHLSKTGSPTDNLTVEIRSGSQTGTLLGTSNTVAASTLTAGSSDILFTFSGNGLALSAATTYWAVAKRSGANSNTNYINWSTDNTQPYANGTFSTFNGTTWSNVAFDARLRIVFGQASASTNSGPGGPFKSSGGNYYLIGIDRVVLNFLSVSKSSAPDTTWSFIAKKIYTSTTIDTVSAYQLGDVIHLAVTHSTGSTTKQVAYVTFNMATDAFVLDEAVQTVFDPTNNFGYSTIVVRGDGHVVIAYNGPKAAVMGTDYARINAKRRTGVATWISVDGSTATLDAGGAIGYYGPISCLGASDRIHFDWAVSSSTVLHRSLSSANVLTTENTTGTSGIGDNRFYGLISYVNGADTKIVVGGSGSGGGTDVQAATGNSSATTTFTLGTALTAPNAGVGSIYVDGTTLYGWFIDQTTQDIYITSSTDDGSTWSAATAIYTGTVNIGMYARPNGAVVYQRGSNIVIPYTFSDGATFYYDEYVVRTVAVGYTLTAETGTVALSGQAAVTRATRTLPIPAQGVIAISGQVVVPKVGLPVTVGTLIASGQATSLVYARKPIAGLGTLTISGQITGLRHDYRAPITVGTITLSGQAIALRATRRMAASQGTITIAGYDVLLTKSTTVTHYTMPAELGTLTLAGQAITFKRNYVVAAGTGTVAMSGQAAALRSGRRLVATQGTVVLAGQATGLQYGRVVGAGLGTVVLAGQTVIPRYSRKLLVPAQGTVVMSGWPVGLSLATARVMPAGLGTVTAAGQDVRLVYARKFVVDVGTVTISGQAVTLRYARRPTVGLGTVVLAGQSAVLRFGHAAVAGLGTITLIGQPVTLARSRKMAAELGTIVISGQVVGLVNSANPAKTMPVTVGTVVVTGQPINLRRTGVMPIGTGTVVAAGQAVGLRVDRRVTADLGTIVLDGRPLVFRRDLRLNVTHGTVVINGSNVVLTYEPSGEVLAGVKVWTGSAWVEKPVKVWSGSAWVQKPVKTWDGSVWQ